MTLICKEKNTKHLKLFFQDNDINLIVVQDNLELTSGVNYNVDSKDLTPAVGLSFNF